MANIGDTVASEEAKEQVRKVCVRLGLLHLAFARTLVEELGERKGKELILNAIRNYGKIIGERASARTLAQGLENVPKDYQGDLPLYGMHDGTEAMEVDGESRQRAYGCVMAHVWSELGEDDLGRLYCYVDPAKYMAFNPNFKLVHTKALPDGDDFCEFAVRPTNEQEREDFADKDAEWSYIDRG